MKDRNELPLWEETGDLPARADEGAGREVAFALESRGETPEGGRGRFLLLLISLILALCVLFVAMVLTFHSGGEPSVTPEAAEKEKVVFVREWDEDSGVLSTPELYAKCSDSVVRLETYGTGKRGHGFGFLIREDGYIATELSVIEGMDRITVRLADGREYPATVVGREPLSELGLLKIEERGLPTLSFGASEEILLGERVVAVGSGCVSTGELSSKGGSVWLRDEAGTLVKKLGVLQISGPSLADYAGAPLLNEYGEVVGIFSSHPCESGGGFVLPSEGISKILETMMAGEVLGEELLAGVVTPAPILGVVGGSASEMGVVGVRIHRFLSGLSSAAVMLKEGDLILSVDGVAVRTLEEIGSVIEEKNPGESVYVTVLRFGQILTFEVVLSGRED